MECNEFQGQECLGAECAGYDECHTENADTSTPSDSNALLDCDNENTQYRLLNSNDVLEIGDEILNDDCETWNADYYGSAKGYGRLYLGQKYNAGFFVPTRRKITKAIQRPY